jgi:hypothetical protein
MRYRLTGAQDPASRIDRVEVESASEDFPEGKVLELDGAPVELSDEQYTKLSGFVQLEPVKDGDVVEAQVVDQPGVTIASLSTDNPPDPGTTPDVGSLDKDGLVVELNRVRATDPQALPGLTERSNKEDLKKGLARYHGQEA